MPFDFHLESVVTNSGEPIPLSPRGLTIFVGANNVGKSRIIWDIATYLSTGNSGTVVASAIPKIQGTVDDLLEWLAVNTSKTTDSLQRTTFSRLGIAVDESSDKAWWASGSPPWFGLGSMLANLLRTDSRLSLLEAVQQYNVYQDSPANPLQVLYTDPSLERALSEALISAFGFGATLHRYGSHLNLLAGEIEPPPTNPPSKEYIDQLNSMPLMKDQGDGVRGFAGLLLGLLATRFPLLLVDEPEAFLHPPQARLLGTLLAQAAHESGSQILLASHSLDIVLGALDAGDCDVTVVRVTRDAHTNPCFTLDPATLRDTWNDPLLRYSRILDSLFHRGVVLCESDSDCRFYEAVLDSRRQQHSLRVEDFLFTHCGGKHRLVPVARALSALHIPTAVIADLDLINDSVLAQSMIEALGGQWSDFSSDIAAINSYAASQGFQPSVNQTRDTILNALDSNTGDRLSSLTVDAIAGAIRTTAGWKSLKMGGVRSIPNGQQSMAAQRVLINAAKIGLFLVPVGELERWILSVGLHGPRWTSEVLSQGLHSSSESDDAAVFSLEALRFLEAR